MATDVDLAIERMIRKFLAETTPTIGFLGEEEGGKNTPTRWVLDPIDGTANFTRGVPLNGISLALVHEQHAMLGVIALPFLGQRYWAADAPARNRVALALHAHLAPCVQRVRMLGSAAVDLAWVADGTLDASITLSNRAWDMAAGTVIARQAGAALFDTDGTPHTTSSHFTIAAAPALRDDILTAVQAATSADHAGGAITGHRQHGAPC